MSGYAYVATRLTATSSAGALAVRDRIVFIQDAFVRDVNGASVTNASGPAAVDNSALEARLLAYARRVMGPGKVASIAIIQLQLAPLHPSPAVTPDTTTPLNAAPATDQPAKMP